METSCKENAAKLKNIPERIYLNLGIADEGDEIDFDELELGEVTWSRERIHDSDIEYVRKVDVDWEARRFELVKEYLKGIMSDPNAEFTIDELADTSVMIVDAIIAKMKNTET